jgi:hypothetical protein
MANSIFRNATKEAIRELITECGEQGRFGLLLANDDLEMATEKIVDLFETTLSLRQRVQERAEMAALAEAQASVESQARGSRRDWGGRDNNFLSSPPSFPRTRSASEIYDGPRVPKANNGIAEMPNAPEFNLRLPRKRVPLTDMEKEKLRQPTP